MIGRSVPRREDDALLRGAGRFVDDVRGPDEAAMVLLRSDVASGRIMRLDAAAALAFPGMIGVLSASDLLEAGVGSFAPRIRPTTVGRAMHAPPYPPLAVGMVRCVGDPILALVAETETVARDALELIELAIEETPCVVDPSQAARGPALWPEAPDNVAFVHESGDAAAVDAAFAAAAHRVDLRLSISRVSAAPIEPRGCLASWDAERDAFALRIGTQTPHAIAASLAALFGLSVERVRVISERCGGSFGMRNAPAPEFAVAMAAARSFRRPVRWIETRTEAFLAAPHARQQVVDAALALDAAGRFLGLRVEADIALGPYLGPSTAHSAFANLGSLAGVYTTPAIHARVRGMHLNTPPVAPYRGAGRPEATYALERLIDVAADQIGQDRAVLRRRNMITPVQTPYRTPLAFTYDGGDFPGLLDRGLLAADWAGFEARRAEALSRGMLRGLGLACPIEIAGGPATRPLPEYARLDLSLEQCVLRVGSGDAGQGHATCFAQILETTLGLPADTVRVVTGDTGEVTRGVGSFGSRTAAAAGVAIGAVAEAMRARLRAEAADHFEVAIEDVVFQDGAFRVAGADLAATALQLVAARELALTEESFTQAAAPTYPCGCHLAEIEIDPETGRAVLLRHVVVDDAGVAVNPAIVAGQIHGGVAQGVGQALFEEIRYDPADGQLLTASFLDYAAPRAADMPFFELIPLPSQTTANPLGVKGVGEAGVVGALPAVASAVADALAPLGVRHLEMPFTAEKIWRAIQAAQG